VISLVFLAELVEMGCAVLEVTMDTPEVARVIAELKQYCLHRHVIIM